MPEFVFLASMEATINIIDSIIDDEDEIEDTEPRSGEEQAENVGDTYRWRKPFQCHVS